MDSSPGSSFIPKTPMSGTLNKRRVRKIYLLTYLIYIFFLGSLLAAGGTWFYKLTLEKELSAIKLALNEERESFNQSDLEKVTELDARITEAKKILSEQVSIVKILKAVERVTLASVDMRGFSFKKDVNTKLVLELSAQASDFNTTLFQRQVLAGDAVLGGSLVTNVTYASAPASEGTAEVSSVIFTVEKDVLPGTISPDASVSQGITTIASDIIVSSTTSQAISAPTTNGAQP